MRYILLALAAISLACETTPPPLDPTDDARDACKPACANLRTLACPEGMPSVSGNSCDSTCARAIQLRQLPLECWAEARDVAELRACGSIRCVR